MKRFILGLMAAVVLLALSAPAAMARDVTLNFKDADIRAFIEFVAGFSGRNFLIDNRVKGKVTIISPSPVSEDAAYAVFLSVLEVNGFAAVQSGTVVKIVPRAEGTQKPLPVAPKAGSQEGDALVTEVIRLKYADASQLMAILRPASTAEQQSLSISQRQYVADDRFGSQHPAHPRGGETARSQ